MANEIKRTIQYHNPIFEDGKYTGRTEPSGRVDEHALHWRSGDDGFEIWAEGDVCIETGIYTYGQFEFDLEREEGRRLYDALGQWLNKHGDS